MQNNWLRIAPAKDDLKWRECQIRRNKQSDSFSILIKKLIDWFFCVSSMRSGNFSSLKEEDGRIINGSVEVIQKLSFTDFPKNKVEKKSVSKLLSTHSSSWSVYLRIGFRVYFWKLDDTKYWFWRSYLVKLFIDVFILQFQNSPVSNLKTIKSAVGTNVGMVCKAPQTGLSTHLCLTEIPKMK